MTESKGRPLYRIPSRGKISGVCAGIADFFNFEVWLVRVLTASIFLLGGSGIVIVLYILLWMILEIKPDVEKSSQSHKEIGVKKKVWQSGEPAKLALKDVGGQFKDLELRLQSIERHVTSDNFDLKNEINRL